MSMCLNTTFFDALRTLLKNNFTCLEKKFLSWTLCNRCMKILYKFYKNIMTVWWHLCFFVTSKGVSVARWIWDLLRGAVWEERSVGDRIPFRVNSRSSVHRKHHEFIGLPVLGALSVHSLVDSGLHVHDTRRIEGRSYYSCKATLLTSK